MVEKESHIKENKEQEKVNIYAQDIWHDDVLILATKDSLYQIKNAIDEALDTGKAKIERRTSDMDVYNIHVHVKEDNDPEWDKVELPYKGEMAQDTEKVFSKQDIIG